MDLQYRLLADGGFVAADMTTRRAAYAYPTSDNAVKARKKPREVAHYMVTCIMNISDTPRNRELWDHLLKHLETT